MGVLRNVIVPAVFLAVLSLQVTCEPRSYDGYKVIRIKVNSEDDVRFLRTLQTSNGQLDFWDFPSDLMVPTDQADTIESQLVSQGLKFDVWIHDVQKLIDGQFTKSPKDGFNAAGARIQSTDPHYFDYEIYHRWAEIDQWVKNTAAKYPTLAEEFIIGRSYEKRAMRALKVGVDTGNEKWGAWYNGGIHAREWVSPATVMWMTNQFLEDYKNNVTEVVTLLETFDLYVLPVMNPDGYEYTWTDERLWRKTRSINLGSNCMGTDPNRNFAYEWGGIGASADPCSIVFRGPYPHSEIEIKDVTDFIRERGKTQKFKLYIDFHSYSQLWLSSWGYTYDLPDDYETMYDQMTVGCEAIKSVHNKTYVYGAGSSVLYATAGSSKDWGYGVMGVPYSYTVELRDTGEYGFVLPEDQILPTCQEMYAGLKAALQFNIDNPYP
ncbi:carboxypeptidase B-like [Ptychodera flava]|uniref:carboxypeptidase B-like n=1 Tax=Ptychodera flava TaxID=63121 RepID=UPI00396A2387